MGMKLDHNIFKVSKLRENQKKRFHQKLKSFSLISSEDQKTVPNIIQHLHADQNLIIEGDADVDPSQIIGVIYPPEF